MVNAARGQIAIADGNGVGWRVQSLQVKIVTGCVGTAIVENGDVVSAGLGDGIGGFPD
ncbi:MAG: hypothetical protein GY845_32225 [Planctomycetes bacterium]|nr:hypothetical protein [Planctomycetota bacterium]